MKTFYIILLNMLLGFSAIAQVSDDNKTTADTTATYKENTYTNDFPKPYIKKSLSTNDKMHFSFQTGANAMSFGNSSMFSTYVAPELSYRLTPKLNIKVGTIALNSNFSNMMYYNYGEGTSTAIPNSTQVFVYLQGEYQLSDRIKLRGTTFREVTSQSNPNSNPFSFNHVGVDFKISDNISMSADFIQSSGRYPLGLYGVNNPVLRSTYPFGGSFNNYGW